MNEVRNVDALAAKTAAPVVLDANGTPVPAPVFVQTETDQGAAAEVTAEPVVVH